MANYLDILAAIKFQFLFYWFTKAKSFQVLNYSFGLHVPLVGNSCCTTPGLWV